MKSWDDQWGHWQGLASAAQAARYRAIATIIDRFCPNGSVLDVGCGEAVLCDYLSKGVAYFGIEPSAKAAESARAKSERDCIVHSTGEDFGIVEPRWDCIVFNEVLYYLANPLALLRRYSNLVRPGGIVIVSIFQKPRNLEAISRPSDGWANLLTAYGMKKVLKSALFRTRLLHRLDRRRPMPRLYCTELVHDFMLKDGWLIEEDTLIAKPATPDHWRVWCGQPRRPRTAGTP